MPPHSLYEHAHLHSHSHSHSKPHRRNHSDSTSSLGSTLLSSSPPPLLLSSSSSSSSFSASSSPSGSPNSSPKSGSSRPSISRLGLIGEDEPSMVLQEEDTPSPKRQSQVPHRRRRRVQVQEEPTGWIHVESLESLTMEEKSRLWYSPYELDQTHKEAMETVVAMQTNMVLADDCLDFTTRGLEYMTPNGFDISKSCSQEIVALVLQEQERQRQQAEQGNTTTATTPRTRITTIRNPEALAISVSSISRHRLRIAHLAAMKDARQVYGDDFKRDVVSHYSAFGRESSVSCRNLYSEQSIGSGVMTPTSTTTTSRRQRRGSRGDRPSRFQLNPSHRLHSYTVGQSSSSVTSCTVGTSISDGLPTPPTRRHTTGTAELLKDAMDA